MSGIEVVGVVGVVAGVISAFHDSLSLYRSWKQKKKERRRNSNNKSLEQSLSLGETEIQQEYDRHFTRLGQRFAVGDYQGRAELNEYVVTLLHTIVALMANSTSSHQVVLPKLPVMLSTSEDTRTGVLSSLGSQYQRLLQTAPVSSLHLPYLNGHEQNERDEGQETLNKEFETLHISAGSDALGSPDVATTTAPSSSTLSARPPIVVDFQLRKRKSNNKPPAPKLKPPVGRVRFSQKSNTMSENDLKPVVPVTSDKPSTTSMVTSPTTEVKLNWLLCGGSLALETTGDQQCYKCSTCLLNVKQEIFPAYFLEFPTIDGFEILINNEEIWNSHEKAYVPEHCLCICKSCGDSIWGDLGSHLEHHTKEELLLSYPGAYVRK